MLEPAQFIYSSLVHAGIVTTPVLIFGLVKKSKPILLASVLTATLYLLQTLVLVIPNFGPFAALKMNWFQKTLACIFVFVAGYLLKFEPDEYGIKIPPKLFQALMLTVATSIVTAVPSVIQAILDNSKDAFNLEFFLFEATMPGLQEELFFRGLLLLVWDRAAQPNFKFLGVNWGIGALVSAALFTLGHTMIFDHSYRLMFAPTIEWFDLIFFALVMSWLRYRCNSIAPGIIAHNLVNCGECLFRCFR